MLIIDLQDGGTIKDKDFVRDILRPNFREHSLCYSNMPVSAGAMPMLTVLAEYMRPGVPEHPGYGSS